MLLDKLMRFHLQSKLVKVCSFRCWYQNVTFLPKSAAISFQNEMNRSIYTNNIMQKSVPAFSSPSVIVAQEETFWKRILYRITTTYHSRLFTSGVLLYRCCTDPINHKDFFLTFNMTDTFFSWFLITELHIWMLLVRVIQEGQEGLQLRKNIIKALWEDVWERNRELGVHSSTQKKNDMQELHEQFLAALVAYDEGLLGNDQVLSGAIWRRFLEGNCDNPEQLEILVSYIRRTVLYLDSLPRENFLVKGTVEWLPLMEEEVEVYNN